MLANENKKNTVVEENEKQQKPLKRQDSFKVLLEDLRLEQREGLG